MAGSKSKGLKQKKKTWYEILAPREFNNQTIGETVAFNSDSLIGRTTSFNLMNLTRDMKKQNMVVKFKIKEVKDGKALTEIVGYNMVPAYVKRVIRTGRTKIDDSVKYVTRDKIKVRIKPLILTRSIINKSVVKCLRKQSREFLKEFIEKQDYENIFSSIISYIVQRKLKSFLRKISPIAVCEIRVFEKI